MGKRSSQRPGRSSRVVRGGIALAVAYAFAIQAMLFGLIGAQLAGSPYDHAAAGFELCLTGAQDGSQFFFFFFDAPQHLFKFFF